MELNEPARPPPLALTELDREVRDEETLRQEEPNEPLLLIPMDPEKSEQIVRMGSKMSTELSQSMEQLLVEHRDVFAWCHEEVKSKISTDAVQSLGRS